MNTPNQFTPTSAADFVGPAGRHAKVILAKCARLKGEGNYRLLFYGPPGTGKSSLAALVAAELTSNPFGEQTATGQSASVAKIREWHYESKLKNMFGDRRVLTIEECDAMSPAALTEFRLFSDDLPPGYDLILTTNKTLKQLQPQLSSRCQHYSFGACPIAELAEWINKRWSLPMEIARSIAQSSRGDVRAALNAVESALDQLMAEVAV